METDREDYRLYVGIDWASTAHRVVSLNAARAVVADQEVAHTGAALAALADELIARAGGRAAAVAVAIEVPRGPVVETLLERGCAVYVLNPKQLDRFRDRYSVAGAKDDRRDAQVLALALITDRAALQRAFPAHRAVARRHKKPSSFWVVGRRLGHTGTAPRAGPQRRPWLGPISPHVTTTAVA